MRAMIDERPGHMTVGELFDGSIREAVAYAAPHHLIFDWALLGHRWNASELRRSIAAREEVFGPARWPANVLSNHDQPRHASWFSFEDGDPREHRGTLRDARAKVAAAMLLTLRGTPFLYYGEEIAQANLVVPNSDAFDPPARRASFLFRWWNRDQARGPIAWSAGPGGGFTAGRPWLPLTADADRRNVAAQAADPDSVLSCYRRLLWLRRSTPALRRGSMELLDVGDRDVLAYRRDVEGGSAFVALNFSDRQASIVLPQAGAGIPWRLAFSTHPRDVSEPIGEAITLAPLEALIVVTT
jgi:alpha-glucosidase